MNQKKHATWAVIAIIAGVVAASHVSRAQETGKVMIDVAECIKLEASEARLACYEARVAAVFGERAAKAAARQPAAPASDAPAPHAVTSQVDRQARREEKAHAQEAAAADDIMSRVKELREVVPNTWIITLDNGQVWRQSQSKQYPLREGQQVRIYGTRWGNASRLSAEGINSFIQVERVR
jgi:hypothetical protein